MSKQPKPSNWSIMLLQRGVIVVGRPTRGGASIRRYTGNGGGLDKPAVEGPEHAVLDNGGIGAVRRSHELTVVGEILIDERCVDLWKKALNAPGELTLDKIYREFFRRAALGEFHPIYCYHMRARFLALGRDEKPGGRQAKLTAHRAFRRARRKAR